MPKKRNSNPLTAGILSLIVPGLGQMYAGKGDRGAVILVAGIIVGTLALIWQTLFITAGTRTFLPYRIVLTIYTLIFWGWQVIDAYKQVK